ncbi:MAG TPA: glycosyltransferase family 39 protein, partial [Chloroflexota bacterium]|nr:glycosyltransferase family 39 protein [Chloroflexota bacterium]
MKVSSSWLSPPQESSSSIDSVEAVEFAPLMLVIAVAVAVRLIWLDHVPTNVMPDEADNMADVYHILAGTGPSLIGFDWTQLPALSVYLMAGFVKLIGPSVLGMRMAVLFTSTLALIPFYFLVRRLVSAIPALLATLMFSTGIWYLNFSRTAWANVHAVLFGLVALWLLLEALDRRSMLLYGLTGGALALNLYGYYAGRATVLAILLFLPVGMLLHRAEWRRVVSGYSLMLVVAIVLFLPQGLLIAQDWSYANTRVASVSIFQQSPPYLGQTDPVRLLMLQSERIGRAFLLLDGSLFNTPRYTPAGSPPVDYVTGALYLAGLVLGTVLLRESLIWYLLLLVPLFITQVLSILTPDTGRAIVVAPVIYLFVALSVQTLWSIGLRRGFAPAVVMLVVAIVAFNIWWYFDWVRSPFTAYVRQPAVELSEFGRWQQLQMERAARGERGFTVTEWHQIRTQPS